MKNKNYIIVSYYTRDTEYEEEKKRLVKSLNRFKLPYKIGALDNRGSWVKNCAQKAEFCLRMLTGYQRPVVWIDADAEVRRNPVLFRSLDCDIAVHYMNGRELLSGTIYLGYTETTIELLHQWIRTNESHPETWDQVNLQRAIEIMKHTEGYNLRLFELPPSYCQIYDLMAHHGDPVIEHNQASRRLKSQIDRKEGLGPS